MQLLKAYDTITNIETNKIIARLCPRSTVVEHLTRNPKGEGSNPASGTERKKMEKKIRL